MPNNITWSAKQRYPQYGEIPDDELTLKYAEAHPQYLSDPEFKADYDRIMRDKQAAVPQPAPELEAGVMESVARRAYGGLHGLGGALWKGGEYVSRAVGATDTAEEARLNYEYAKAEADAQRAKSAQTGIGKYAGMVAEALPSILPAIAVAPAGLAGMAVASGVTGGASTLGTAEDAYRAKYLKEGFSEEEASAKARISALAPAAASGLATGLITKGFGAKGVEALASKAVTREAAKKLIAQNLPTALVKGATSEAIEEGVDQAAQAVIERMSYNPDLTLAEAVEQIAQAAFVGGALGGGVAGLRHPGEVRQAQAIVAQERAEKAAVAAEKADAESRIKAEAAAAAEQKRIEGMTPEDRLIEEKQRLFEEQQRYFEENQPILQAEEDIKAQMGREFKAKRRTEFERGLAEAVREEYEAAQGIPSPEEFAGFKAEGEIAPLTSKTVAQTAISKAPVSYQFLGADAPTSGQQAASATPPPQQADFAFTKGAEAARESIKKNMIRFASGMSAIGDLKEGTYARGRLKNYGVGFDVGLLSKNAVDTLASSIINLDTQAFIDSGAFSNFNKSLKHQGSGRTVEALDFDKVFEKYDSILDAIDKANPEERADYPRPLMVMPDIIGNQKASLDLIEKYKNRVAAEIGADIAIPIIPIPLGELTLSQAYGRIVEILESNTVGAKIDPAKFIVGIPSNAKAVSKEALAKFLRESKPLRIHFLGAAADRNIAPLIDVVSQNSPNTSVTADASKVRSAILSGVAKGKTRKQAIFDALFQEDDPQVVLDMASQELLNDNIKRVERGFLIPAKAPAKRKPSSAKSLGEDARTAPSGDHAMIKTVAKDAAPDESVDVVHDPDLAVEGRIVEGYVDDNGRIVLNSAAPRMSDPAHVRMVVREERAHRLLNSDEGKEALNKFVGRLTPSEKAELQAEGYVQAQGETAGEYDVRLHNEFIAKQARENSTKWSRIVDGVRRFMARFGLRLNNAEVARAILRQLSDPSTANYSIVDRFREKYITNYAFFDVLQDKAESVLGKKLPYRLIHAFEQIQGASGKAKAEYRELRDGIEQLVPDKIKEFETMASLLDARGRFAEAVKIRAEIARLEAGPMDVKVSSKIEALKESLLQFENVVHNHERMTARLVEAKIAALEGELSADGSLRDVMKALDVYRNYMHKNAEMKHASGLISDKELARYKSAYFYMPRVNTSVREELPGYSSGKGRVGQTNTKDVYLDALDAAHHLFNKDFARADKNKAILLFRDAMKDPVLRHLAEVVDKKSASGGFVTGYENGQEFYIKTDPSIAAAVNFSVGGINDLTEIARAFSSVQRFGAITASLPFQFFNLFANDLPNLALMSNAGIKSPKEFVMFFQSLWEGFDTARSGNFGKLSQAHQDWLRTGASASFSSAMRDTFKVGDFKEGGFFDYISRIGQMIEETSKIAGMRMLLKRAGVKNISELSPEDAINLRNEVRNFAGSPDFLRGGSVIKSARVGIWLPFVPAAIQGQSTAMRLFDFSESRSQYEKDAANAARIRVGFVVGTAAYAAYAMNHLTDELEREYDKVPDEVKRNNFMFPQFTYRTASDGSKVMNYFRLPKKGFIKLISNPIEDAMDFYKKTDTAHFQRMLAGAAESILPVDITGETPEKRLMGVLSSVNPAERVIAEFATSKSFYRRGDIVPQRMRDVKATEQYTERTNDDVKAVATLIGMSPLQLRNAIDGLTGGIAGTLLPEKSLEGDRGLAKVPIINRLTWSASRDQGESDVLDKYREAGATESLNRFREADAFVKARKGMDARTVLVEAASRYGQENRYVWEKVRELVIARDRGLNSVDMRVLQLPPRQRAQYILHELGRLPEQSRAEYINDARKKHILTRETAMEMHRLGFRWS